MLWLLNGIIDECDINPGRIATTLEQVVGANLVKVTLLMAEFIPLLCTLLPPQVS